MATYERNSIVAVIIIMAAYFILAHPAMMDDGFQYRGFAESLAHGHLDFKSFYGFQGLSVFAVPIYLLTHSSMSIIITSMIFSLLSIPLAYAVGRHFGSGLLAICLFLLTPYPYVTMMRGFQESALLFFILLVIYGALEKKSWTGLAWGIGAIVKPFSLVLLPLFIRKGMKKIEIWFLVFGVCVIGAYGIANYVQTGHFVTLAATGSYQGVFDANKIPALGKSFTLNWKSAARVPANLLIATRKIMVSPIAVILGFVSLLRTKNRRYMLAVFLNLVLVGLITYAFPKYLLPATTLLSLLAIPLLIKYHWLALLVFVDSIIVFVPIYNYFGHNFWSPVVFYVPLLMSFCLYVYTSYYPNAERA